MNDLFPEACYVMLRIGTGPLHFKRKLDHHSSSRRGEFEKCFKIRGKIGGHEGTRIPAPLLAKQVLSQLSYTPPATI